MNCPLIFRAAFIAAACLCSTTTWAASPNDVARADALFQEARQLMRANRYDQACPKLEESQRLDPAPGTRLNLADCLEHAGLTASAYREFVAVALASERRGENERAAIARARATQLESKLPRLSLEVPSASRVAGLVLRQNSSLVPESAWGTAWPVDPGVVVVEASAPDRVSFRRELTVVSDGTTRQVTIPELLPLGTARPAATAATATAPAAAQHDSPTSSGVWLERSGVGVSALGAVGVTLGAVLGVRAVNLYHRSKDQGCDADDVCTPDALETRRDAVRAGNQATVSFIVGGALLATGAGLYIWGSNVRAEERGVLTARVAPLGTSGAFATLGTRF